MASQPGTEIGNSLRTPIADYPETLERSRELEGGMGAVAFACLEMFRRGGMADREVELLHAKMKQYFMNPSNEECNVILRVVETRLEEEKLPGNVWYPVTKT